MMKSVFSILPVFFVILTGFSTWAGTDTRPRVLLISSYHPGFPTFFQQIEGVKSAFGDRQIVFDVEFMDSKRFPDRANIENFCSYLSYKLSLTGKYDAVMTADDNALVFVSEYRHMLFPDVPVVFFGVNDMDRAVSLSADSDITGVVEAVSMKETISLMFSLFPESRKIIAISDATPSGIGDSKTYQQLTGEFPGKNFSHISLAEISFEQLPGVLKKIPSENPVLLLSAYTDRNGKTLLFEESLKIIRENLSAPIWHLWYHGIGDGLIGGKVISHHEQGKTAGEMVMRILDGTDPANIPLVRESPNRYIFDHHELRRFGISLSDLPEDSLILHLPSSFYREHRAVFGAFMGVFLCFLMLILIMAFHIRRRRQAETALRESRNRYSILFEHSPLSIWEEDFSEIKNYIENLRSSGVNDFHSHFTQNPASVRECARLVRVLQINTETLRLFGVSSKEEFPDRMPDYFTDESWDIFREELIALARGETHFECEMPHRLGQGDLKILFLKLQVVPGYEHSLSKVLISFMDITRLKHTEKALRDYQEHLAEKVERRTSQLRESEERQRELLKGIPVPAYIWQKQGEHFVLADYNDAAYEVTNGNIASTLGVNASQFYADRPDIPADMLQCFAQKAPVHREMEYVMKTTGVIKWLSVKYAFVRPNFVIVHTDDISQRKEITRRLSELLDLNQKIIASSRLGIIAYKGTGECILANEATAKIVGAPVPRLMEQNFRNIVSWKNSVLLEKAETALRTGEGQETEAHIVSSFGKESWLAAFFSPFISGGEPHLLLIIDDISERKEAEKALREAKEEAERANKAKSAFLANMSHELRTPLNAVLGFSQLMERDSQISGEQRKMLKTIIRSGEHLLNLINDVLEMSRIEAGRILLEKEDFDLIRTIDSVKEMMQSRTSAKGLELIVDCDPDLPRYICTDQQKLRQVLINLLNNAIKFTREGGVTLRVRQEKPAEKGSPMTIVFEVEDTGIGISEEDRGNLFSAFVQARTLEKDGEGTGLGLSISRCFVQLMGGDISVRSRVDHGSVFRFHIQAEAGKAKENDIPKSPRRVTGLALDQPEFRILIVEDRPESRLLLNRLLSSVGFAVREAVNGKEGVEIFEKWHPHLIWMDIRMPVMDGYDATRQIRALPGGDACVIIALTASAFEEQKSLILSAGCDDFIRKPFRTADIFDAMHRHIGVRYVYEDEPQHTQEKGKGANAENISEALAGLSPEHLADLEKALINLDMETISAVIGHIRAKDREAADAMAEMADNFRYEQLMNIVSQFRNSSQEGSNES